jgi:4-amino-4-deoxy-L-arabinose transferase-like glycosyltransferase
VLDSARNIKVIVLLAVATCGCLLPFLNKAVCIDDPLFVWAAQQIQKNPFDFYGRQVNWYGTSSPLSDVTKNPPLACFYLAFAATLLGARAAALHAALLLPAVGAICGTWFLAGRFCERPVAAALLALFTPAFLVSSTNLMCDVMMVCWWTWAIALWIYGLVSEKSAWLGTASILIVAAALTKYFGICLIPLLGVYTIVRQGRSTRQVAWLLLPIAALGAYQAWTYRQYGRGLLSDAAVYATMTSSALQSVSGANSWPATAFRKSLIAFSFTGASFLPILFCAVWIWSKPKLAVVGLFAVAIAGFAMLLSPREADIVLGLKRGFTWTSAIQLGLFSSCGLLALVLAGSNLARRPSADSLLLTLWVAGTFVFAGYLNWTCNVRSVLPMVPALAILVVRRAEDRMDDRERPTAIDWRWMLVPSAALAIAVAWADYCLANSARMAAIQISTRLQPQSRRVWFQGHWGFQYYFEPLGARPLDRVHPSLQRGDFLVNPYNNTNVYFFPAADVEPFDEMKFPACGWLTTSNPRVGAGFYSSVVGPLPFVFGPAPPEVYGIFTMKHAVIKP